MRIPIRLTVSILVGAVAISLLFPAETDDSFPPITRSPWGFEVPWESPLSALLAGLIAGIGVWVLTGRR